MSKANRIKGEFNELLGCRVAVTEKQIRREGRIRTSLLRKVGFAVIPRTSAKMPVRALKRAANSEKKEAKKFTPVKQEAGLQGYQFIMGVLSRGTKVVAA